MGDVRTWVRTRHDLLSRASAKLIRPCDVEDPVESLGARFDDAADSGEEEAWSGEEGGRVIKAELCSHGSRYSALWRCKRRKNPRAAAFAAEEAEVFKNHAVLYACKGGFPEDGIFSVR